MSTFKIAVISIFSVAILIGLVLFAMSKGSSSSNNYNIVVWGTVGPDVFDTAYKNSSILNDKTIKVSYTQINPSDFEQSFIGALADGNGPDLVILRDDFVYENRNKIFEIPYKNFTAREFKDTFIEEGELYLDTNGIISVPFMVDPLVMYWNRDMFSNSVISQPPKYWDEMYTMIDKMTKRDNNANILQAAVALGEWSNIVNAKEILSMILMQAGTPITLMQNGTVSAVLNSSFNNPIPPGESAVNFFTQFSNPTSVSTYTWNRSLPNSLNMFLSGSLAMYIGFASEISGIQQKNSNLNFDVTYAPQIRNAPKKTVFGRMYSLSIVKQSKQIAGAYTVLRALTEPASIKAVETLTNLPPVRRDLLANRPTDAFRSVFYDSALLAHTWIDPNPLASSNTLGNMIESITGGKSRVSEALNSANDELMLELK